MSAYLDYLTQDIHALRLQADSLKAANREDEAALCRVRINIEDICMTVYNVCKKMASPDDFSSLYLQKLDRLPASWKQSRALAGAHGDSCKVIIEDIKLDTLARSRAKFLELEC